ncbi:unnamed protein product, partial [Meganyctiphanes norvegica]
MPSMRHACTVLLLVGACSALPQYPGQGGKVDDGFQQQQQQSGGLIPAGPVTSQCLSHQDCVPYFQCVDGLINTDGEGLLDLRITPKGTCSQPDNPDVPALCCNLGAGLGVGAGLGLGGVGISGVGVGSVGGLGGIGVGSDGDLGGVGVGSVGGLNG